jgi:hypothetical protein
MRTLFSRKPHSCATPGWAVVALLLASTSPALAQPANKPMPEDPAWANYEYQPASSCNTCHSQPAQYKTELALTCEYSIWKAYDKHAQAYAVLEGERGQKMAKALGMDVTKEEAGCLNCHAMASKGGSIDIKDGVSCGGCHGPSSKWKGPHADPVVNEMIAGAQVRKNWKELTPAQKHFLGFRDLRDPAIRSRLCASCHVGNAAEGKVVTHPMFAAGHPPLPPIEVATFSSNEPQHWRNSRDVPYLNTDVTPEKNRDYHLQDVKYQQTKLALVGAVVTFREAIRLAHDRADFKSPNPGTTWPELLQGKDAKLPAGEALQSELQARWPDLALAHSDCYACHHELDWPGYRQARGFGYQLGTFPVKRAIPGRVPVRVWPTAMVEAAVLYTGKKERLKELQEKLDALTAVYTYRPFAKPEDLVKATQDLITWSDQVVQEIDAVPCTEEKAKAVIKTLTRLYAGEGDTPPILIPDFEAARQIASVVKVIAEELKINGKASGFDADLQKLVQQLDIVPYMQRSERINITLDILSTPNKPEEMKDREKFVEFMKRLQHLGEPGDEPATFAAALKDLSSNSFLGHVRVVLNDEFNEGFKKKASKLQELGDKEQAAYFHTLDAYDPAEFRKNLRAVVDKLTK